MSANGFALKDETGRSLRFEPAPMDVEIVDIWPPGTLTEQARDAYDILAGAGRIRPKSARRDAAGRVIVRYLADCPEQWVHEELRAAKLAGRQLTMEEIK